MPPLFSHSRLSSFENCPKQFHFRYVLEIPQTSEGIEAFVGKRVHEILERLYAFVGRGRLPSLEQVLARYQALWDEHFDAERTRIVKAGYSVDYYRDLGARCLDGFYRRHYPFDHDESLGLEKRVVFSLDEAGQYRFQGIIDRVVRARDGAIEIQDYKTGAYVPSQKKLDEDRQLALYQIGIAREYGPDQPVRLVWHYLQKGQVRTSTRSQDQLAALRRDTMALIDRIADEQAWEPTPTRLCGWCEYRAMCPAFASPEEADRALTDALKAGPIREAAPDGPPSSEVAQPLAAADAPSRAVAEDAAAEESAAAAPDQQLSLL